MKAVSRSFSGVRKMALFPSFANPHVFINAIAQRDVGYFRPTIFASRPTLLNQALNRSKQQLLPLRVATIARVIMAGAGRGEEGSGDFGFASHQGTRTRRTSCLLGTRMTF